MKRALVALLLVGCATTPPPPPPEEKRAPEPVKPQPLTCPTAMPATEGAVASVLGATIEKVCLVGASEDTYLRLHETVAPREGTTLAATAVSDDLEKLFDLGMVKDVSAVAQPSGDKRVVLTYFVTEYPFIKAVKLEGVAGLPNDELAELVPSGRPASAFELQRMKNVVAERYASKGFARAQVEVSGTTEVTLKVTEGPRTTVQAIRFDGAKQVPKPELLKALGSAVGQPFREAQTEVDATALTFVYFDRGMVEVAVTSASAAVAKGPEGAVELVFTIKEGPVYKLGKISANGDKAGSDPKMLAGLESKPKSVFSRAALKRDIDRVREWCRQHGAAVEVTPITNVDKDKRIIDVTFELEKKTGLTF